MTNKINHLHKILHT